MALPKLLRSVFFIKNLKFNQSNLRVLVQNTLLNNTHSKQNTACTWIPMERHIYIPWYNDSWILACIPWLFYNVDLRMNRLLIFWWCSTFEYVLSKWKRKYQDNMWRSKGFQVQMIFRALCKFQKGESF